MIVGSQVSGLAKLRLEKFPNFGKVNELSKFGLGKSVSFTYLEKESNAIRLTYIIILFIFAQST